MMYRNVAASAVAVAAYMTTSGTANEICARRGEFDVCCDDSGGLAYNTILSGVDYLSKIGDVPANIAPHSCDRVSCEWNTAIFLCSEGDEWARPPFSEVAGVARALARYCLINNNHNHPDTKQCKGHTTRSTDDYTYRLEFERDDC